MMYGITTVDVTYLMPYEWEGAHVTHRKQVIEKAKSLAFDTYCTSDIYKDGALWLRVYPDGEIFDFESEFDS